MGFEVAAEAYGRFMGRYAEPLAAEFASFAGVVDGQRVLDVGCGPGALTALLADRLGPLQVAAVDPSPPFVAATIRRCPGVDVQPGVAEELPYANGMFDAALAQLVVHFMKDPVAGLKEMARVTSRDGTVAACVWDHASGSGPLSTFWDAVREVDPDANDESELAGSREGHLAELFAAAGLDAVESDVVVVRVEHPSFEEWWEPYTLGVGPAGDHVKGLDEAARARLMTACRARLPEAPFTIEAKAWAARATV